MPTYTHKTFDHHNRHIDVLHNHQILQCDDCGSLVTDTQQHDDWHWSLRQHMQMSHLPEEQRVHRS